MDKSKIIFLTGLPRAMTTLTANLLANNPRIIGGETSPLLEYIYGARNNYGTVPEVKSALSKEIMHDSFLNFCRNGMKGYAESMMSNKEGSEIFLDKSRGWIHYAPFLYELFPNAKVIVCVRDLRGIVASFEKKWRLNPSIQDGRDVPAQQMFITIDQRVNAWLSDAPLGLALKRVYNAWQTRILENMLVIKAEDLCKNPKSTMSKVYEFIEEPYFDMDYNSIKQMTVENDRISDFGIYGDHKIKEKIELPKKDWNEILTPQLSNIIKSNFQWYFEQFNYY